MHRILSPAAFVPNCTLPHRNCNVECEIIIGKLLDVKKLADDANLVVTKAASTIENSYEILLEGYGYTIGKIIEYILHRDLYAIKKKVTYVGFRKNHPHDSNSFIRIAYSNELINLTDVREDVSYACEQAVKIYSTIMDEFV